MNASSSVARVAAFVVAARLPDSSAGMERMIVYATVQHDTSAVRPTERLDRALLASYLRGHLPPEIAAAFGSSPAPDIEISQFPGGHSNLTYLARVGGVELVVRRPPL